MGSITGLKTGNFTDINNSGEFRVTDQQLSGTAGQALISGGEGEPVTWGTHTGTINALTMGTDLSLASGNASFDGSIADTINAAGHGFGSGGNGIDITGTTITTDNDGTTINNTGGTGAQNQVLKVPNALTQGTNISFSSGTTYDGSAAITISSTDTDTTYQGSSTINIDTTTNPDTINCLKVPGLLTAGNHISMVVTADGAGATTYDGSEGITITGTANTDTQLNLTGGDGITVTNTGGLNRTITTDNDGTTITNSGGTNSVIKVPNNLTAGDGVTMFNTDDGAVETTYSGVNPITINCLPHDVFEVGGAKRMTINLSNFMPDDDSSFYNIGVEDDLSTKIHGSLRVLNSSIEVCGFFVIPNGFTATACRIDVTNSSGAAVSRTLNFESFTTYGATGYSSLGTGTTNSEQTFSTTLPAASDKLLLIRINTTTTSDHIRGGYIRLT